MISILKQWSKGGVTTLDRLTPKETAAVVRVDGDDAVTRRLVDLGFWPGTEVSLVRKAPLGDPGEYALRGYRLALRRGEARRVIVLRAASERPPEQP
ncbi:MAG: FeoA family protein [Myxococcota bacterium]